MLQALLVLLKKAPPQVRKRSWPELPRSCRASDCGERWLLLVGAALPVVLVPLSVAQPPSALLLFLRWGVSRITTKGSARIIVLFKTESSAVSPGNSDSGDEVNLHQAGRKPAP